MRPSSAMRCAGRMLCCAVLLLGSPAMLLAELELQVVKAHPGKIMAGDKVLAEVPAGTLLWIFNKKSGWAEVKVPGGDEHGWMKLDGLQPEEFTGEQKKLLGTASPLFTRYTQLAQGGQYRAALETLEAAAKLERQALGEDHPNLAVTLLHLGRTRNLADDFAGAEQAYNDCLALRTKHLGKLHYDIAEVLNELASLYRDRGDTARALEYNTQVLELLPKVSESTASDFAAAYSNRGTIQHVAGDYGGARKSYMEALQQERRLPGNQELSLATTLQNYAQLLVAARQEKNGAAHPFFWAAWTVTGE